MIMQDGSDAVRLTAGAADEIGKEGFLIRRGRGLWVIRGPFGRGRSIGSVVGHVGLGTKGLSYFLSD